MELFELAGKPEHNLHIFLVVGGVYVVTKNLVSTGKFTASHGGATSSGRLHVSIHAAELDTNSTARCRNRWYPPVAAEQLRDVSEKFILDRK